MLHGCDRRAPSPAGSGGRGDGYGRKDEAGRTAAASSGPGTAVFTDGALAPSSLGPANESNSAKQRKTARTFAGQESNACPAILQEHKLSTQVCATCVGYLCILF